MEETNVPISLSEIARRFYMDDVSKVEIAKEYSISRFKVARLLEEARERGIVRIKIVDPANQNGELALQLREHLLLDEVVLVPADRNVVVEREALGAGAAKLLKKHIGDGARVGLSWGRTLMPIAAHLDGIPNSEFIQIAGVIGNDPSRSPIILLGQITEHSGSTGKALIAPLFCTSSEAAYSQRLQPDVARVLSMYDSVDMAFVSVGAWDSRATQLEDYIPIEDAQLLDQMGAVADSSGMFFDASGTYLDTPLNERRISIDVDQLAAVPIVTAVAGGLIKVNAIHAFCQSGIPTCLVTTTEVAQALLELPQVEKRVYR